MPIVPTVGRVVWFYSYSHRSSDQPQAAIVSYVHNDNCVNLAIFNSDGQPLDRPPATVRLLQDNEPPPWGTTFCCWMPYQKSVAAGTIPPVLHETKK